ncbi:MAG: Tetratricopeptide 2 repeat protein [Xanthobacteraceae bacterium]|jgi:Flp pilus assembly protein TadD|nr:Tetratricopeptide 2 repeat protein [Xanthobacteraceae bacterium]
MRVGVVRVSLVIAACLLWLVGCETQTKLGDLWKRDGASASDPATTGSLLTPNTSSNAGLMGSDPYDDLNHGKRFYREGAYGLAERHFRRAVEQNPRDGEGWVGLAASYDRLKRFDLADRAYTQARTVIGPSPELLNNQGYSYMLRGDFKRARKILAEAEAKDPSNPFVKNNIRLLEESLSKGKAIESN